MCGTEPSHTGSLVQKHLLHYEGNKDTCEVYQLIFSVSRIIQGIARSVSVPVFRKDLIAIIGIVVGHYQEVKI